MINKSRKVSRTISVIAILWLVITAWFIYVYLTDASSNMRYSLGATYGLMALLGGVTGIAASRGWGGLKSKLGRTIFFLACGLLAAEFGQLVFSYYNVIKGVEIPYPSVADIGFFLNIPLYIIALSSLWQVSGTKYSLAKHKSKLLILLLPPVGLIFSYMNFLKGYDFTDASKLRVFLDFGYPLGQAVYVTIALSILILSVGSLGGIMKKRVMLLVLAFVAQYVADFNFLYQTLHETWVNGAYGDYLYFIAYTFMTLALSTFLIGLATPTINAQAEPKADGS